MKALSTNHLYQSSTKVRRVFPLVRAYEIGLEKPIERQQNKIKYIRMKLVQIFPNILRSIESICFANY